MVLSIWVTALSFVFVVQSQRCEPAAVVPKNSSKPNFVVILLDDMDWTLGSWEHALPQTTKQLVHNGATATNWFCHTPVCCPSRAQMLTGRYFHNIRQPNPTDHGCMHVASGPKAPIFNKSSGWYFAPYLHDEGYHVGIFGKHLNSGNPACPPPGVDYWFANGGGDYMYPSFLFAEPAQVPRTEHFKNCTPATGSCYSTSVIGNRTVQWIQEVVETRRSFFALVAVKAPHVQDSPSWPKPIPAPWHAQAFPGVRAPRTPNWNVSCPDHHWLIRSQPPMTEEEAEESDSLYRMRLQSILSVDDTVTEIMRTLERLEVVDNTYVLFTSDHGYRFGQFSMPQGKWNVYDNDIRIPFVIRGPGIAPKSSFDQIASTVDLIPTVLGLADIQVPVSMDGRSLADVVLGKEGSSTGWRTEQLIEYNDLGNVVRYQHLEDSTNNTFRALRIIDPNAPVGQRNIKVAEFTTLDNWDFKKEPDEMEVFDLDTDPYEMKNIAKTVDPSHLATWRARLKQLFECHGNNCN